MSTKQIDLWKSEFGAEYAARNPVTEESSRHLVRRWSRMLSHAIAPFPHSVLEVGCNLGRNLVALLRMVPEVHAVEPNLEVVERARGNPALAGARIQAGTSFDLPYEDGSIDLVFTSGVLIHVAPEDLPKAVDEVVRVARHYVLCIEYFSHEPAVVPYRGLEGHLFKRDFGRFYAERFPSLRVLDYGFFWKPVDAADNSNWWLFAKA
jgi:pseudaminic acid biosynthesis-associated methylase